jgi:hypothetical protein
LYPQGRAESKTGAIQRKGKKIPAQSHRAHRGANETKIGSRAEDAEKREKSFFATERTEDHREEYFICTYTLQQTISM